MSLKYKIYAIKWCSENNVGYKFKNWVPSSENVMTLKSVQKTSSVHLNSQNRALSVNIKIVSENDKGAVLPLKKQSNRTPVPKNDKQSGCYILVPLLCGLQW